MAQMAMRLVSDMHINVPFQRRRICLDIIRLSFPTYLKIGTLGVHVSAQRSYMVAMKKFFHSQLLSKHSYLKVTIQPAAGYLVNCWLYGDFSYKSYSTNESS